MKNIFSRFSPAALFGISLGLMLGMTGAAFAATTLIVPSTNLPSAYNSAGNIVGTSTPPFDHIVATSTATSTFGGGLQTAKALDVRGTASSTFANGINLAAGCYSVNGTCLSSSAGTVTSVALSVPSILSISGSPITTSGTLAISYSGTALPIANGGTAATSFTTSGNGVYYTGSALATAPTNSAVTYPYASTTAITSTTASTTNLIVSSVLSALHLGNSSGAVTAYAGSAPCTNQVALSISAAGVITCSSITDAMFSGQLGVTHGGTGLASLNQGDIVYASAANIFSALAKNTSATRYLSNTGSSNNPAWAQVDVTTGVTGILPIANGGTNASSFGTTNGITAYDATRLVNFAGYTLTSGLLTATNASTTNITASQSLNIPSSATQTPTSAGQVAHDTTNDQLKLGTGSATAVFDQRRFLTFTYATSTAWTGTTTLLALGTAPTALTLTSVQCYTDVGTLNVQYQYATGPTFPNMVMASTTIGTQPFTSNNTPAAGNAIAVKVGTPASAPTSISCTISATVTGT